MPFSARLLTDFDRLNGRMATYNSIARSAINVSITRLEQGRAGHETAAVINGLINLERHLREVFKEYATAADKFREACQQCIGVDVESYEVEEE